MTARRCRKITANRSRMVREGVRVAPAMSRSSSIWVFRTASYVVAPFQNCEGDEYMLRLDVGKYRRIFEMLF